MILRKIIAYTILPLIMLFIGVLGIVYPEKVNKSRWISKPFEFKTLNKNDSLEDLIEISRMYSSEIEYSTENIDILLEALS